MAFPSFEQWQAPWEKKGEEFDADIAKKFIYNLQKEADTTKAARATEKAETDAKVSELEAKVQEFEDKDLSETERLRKENERLKEKGKAPESGKDDLTQARLEIALEKGLTLAQSRRLAGGTREELEADADAYKAEVTGKQDQDDDGDDDDFLGENGNNGETPGSRPQGPLRGGFGNKDMGASNFDPSKMAETIGRY